MLGAKYHRGERQPRGLRGWIEDRLRKLRFEAVPPLYFDRQANTLYYEGDDAQALLWIEVTGPADSMARYSWKELVPDPSGNLIPGSRTGKIADVLGPLKDPAHELNGNDSVPNGHRAEAWRDSRGFLRFRASGCD